MVTFEQKLAKLKKDLARANKEKSKFNKIVKRERAIVRQKQKQKRELASLKKQIKEAQRVARSGKFRKVTQAVRVADKSLSKAGQKARAFARNKKTQSFLKTSGRFLSALSDVVLDDDKPKRRKKKR